MRVKKEDRICTIHESVWPIYEKAGWEKIEDEPKAKGKKQKEESLEQDIVDKQTEE